MMGKTPTPHPEEQPGRLSLSSPPCSLRPGMVGNLSVERSAGNLHAMFVRGTEASYYGASSYQRDTAIHALFRCDYLSFADLYLTMRTTVSPPASTSNSTSSIKLLTNARLSFASSLSRWLV